MESYFKLPFVPCLARNTHIKPNTAGEELGEGEGEQKKLPPSFIFSCMMTILAPAQERQKIYIKK